LICKIVIQYSIINSYFINRILIKQQTLLIILLNNKVVKR